MDVVKMSQPNDSPTQTQVTKNPQKMHCKRCKCLLLRPNHGCLVDLKEQLPMMDVSTKDKDGNSFEEVTSFCQVDDIYTFENMGFSHTVDNKKYLACPECELGPLGFHDLLTKKSFLSMDRVVDETTLNQTQDTAAF